MLTIYKKIEKETNNERNQEQAHFEKNHHQ